jgi:hypothetical protein
MKTKLSTGLNAATWIVACLLTLQPLVTGQPAKAFTTAVVATLFWMAVYYLFFLYVAPEFLLTKKLVTFFAVSIGILIVLPFIGYSLLFLVRAIADGKFNEFYKGYSVMMHLSGFKALALAGVYGSFFRLITEYFKES